MAKSKKKQKSNYRPKHQPQDPTNRRQRRAQERKPAKMTSAKPVWLRVLIVALIAAMVLGVAIAPFIR